MTVGSVVDPLRGLRGSTAAITVAMLLMVGAFIALGASEGGYFPVTWLPAALLALGLLVTALLTISTRAAVPRAVVVASALLGAYAAWSYLSIIWADDPGVALEGANRTLMYALVFSLFALWPMQGKAAAIVMGALGIGLAGLALVTLLRAVAAADVSAFLVYGRFAAPVGYTNGNVALWFTGFFPCLLLAARREVSPALRGLALGGAGLLAGLALMTQSRGWLFVLPLALPAFLALGPGRARKGVALLTVGAAVALAGAPILAVFEQAQEQPLEGLVDDAARAILLEAAILAMIGLLVGLVDRRVRLGSHSARRVALATGAVLGLAVVASAGVGLASIDDPAGQVARGWEEFKSGSEAGTAPGGAVRFTSLAGNRYDFWRVAVLQFEEHPLAGAGADNFQDDYLANAQSPEQPRYPHSLELRLLGQTGLVGTALFAAAVVVALLVGARAALRRSGLAGAAAGGALATFLYWLLHGSVDWFFEIPGLAGPAFAMLGLSCALARRHQAVEPRRSSRTLVGGRLGASLLVLPTAVALLALSLPWLSQRQTDRATKVWQDDTAQALQRLETASSLNPLATLPHTTAAAIAVRLGDLDLARRELQATAALHPRSAYAAVQLGALESERGDRGAAIELLERAEALAPRDTVARRALETVRRGGQLEVEEVYDALLERRSALTGGD